MITKLLLQEKIADINAKLSTLDDEIQAGLSSLNNFIKTIRDEIQDYDLEATDQTEILKINDSLEGCYDDLRAAKDSLYIIESSFRRLSSKKGGTKW